eukprot:TCONS_00053383-protein
MYVILASAFGCFVLLQFFYKLLGFTFWDSSNLVYGIYGVGVVRSIEWYFYTNPEMLDMSRIGDAVTWQENLIVAVSAGYFLYDLPLSIKLGEAWYMFLHHVLSFLITLTIWYNQRCGFDILLCLWLGEFTTPCAFWVFHVFDKPELKKSKWIIAARVAYVVFFIPLRFILGPFLLYKLLFSETLLIVKLGCGFFYLVNLLMLRDIAKEIKAFLTPWKSQAETS